MGLIVVGIFQIVELIGPSSALIENSSGKKTLKIVEICGLLLTNLLAGKPSSFLQFSIAFFTALTIPVSGFVEWKPSVVMVEKSTLSY